MVTLEINLTIRKITSGVFVTAKNETTGEMIEIERDTAESALRTLGRVWDKDLARESART